MLALLTGDPRALARASDAEIAEPAEAGEAPAPPVDPLQDAAEMVKRGEHEQAWLLLEPMLAEKPDDPTIVNLSCNVAARLETSTTAEPICRRALELVRDDPAPALYLAFVLLELDRDASAPLAEAERRLDVLGERAAREGWAFLARLHQRALSVTAAERAAAKAEGTEDAIAIPKWAEKIRRDFGLARGAIEPEREGAYLRRRTELNELTRKRRFGDARKMAERLAAEYPGLPGPDATLCYMFVSERAHREALEHCARAITAEPDSAQLRVLIGYAAFGARNPAAAIPHLEKAVSMQPKQKDVWSLLAAAYRAAGKRDELAELRGRYRERFGEQLR
jgi:predicted Zn-dependent protease